MLTNSICDNWTEPKIWVVKKKTTKSELMIKINYLKSQTISFSLFDYLFLIIFLSVLLGSMYAIVMVVIK